jgi:hypothetical protein
MQNAKVKMQKRDARDERNRALNPASLRLPLQFAC